MAVSYRRNRDYSKQILWTQEMNENLYNCFKKAREDPRIGYMNRIEKLWDEIYPEHTQISSKVLYEIKQNELRNAKIFQKHNQTNKEK